MVAVDRGFAKARQLFKEQGGTLRTSRAIQLGMLFGTPVRSNNLAAASTDSPQHRPSQARSGSCRNSHSSRRSLPHFSAGLSPTEHAGSDAVDVALPAMRRFRRSMASLFGVFWYPEPSIRAGVEIVAIDDASVKIYSPEKKLSPTTSFRTRPTRRLASRIQRSPREGGEPLHNDFWLAEVA